MPFNGSGVYTPPGASYPPVAGQKITVAKFTAVIGDISSALSAVITKDGQTTTTAEIPFAQGISVDTISEYTSGNGVNVQDDFGVIGAFSTSGGENTFALQAVSGPEVAVVNTYSTAASITSIGTIPFTATNSAASAYFEYAGLKATIGSSTAGAEYGKLALRTRSNGSTVDTFTIGQGLYANGLSDIGAGIVNAVGVYKNGTALPYVDATNTFTASQNITLNGNNTPTWSLYRNDSTPTAADFVGGISFYGNDAALNQTLYGDVLGRIVDTTNGSEDGEIVFRRQLAGALTEAFSIRAGLYANGLSDVPEGAINATDFYKNGVKIDVTHRRNHIINGSMYFAQRATSATASGASFGQISLDRWGMYFPAGASLTLERSTDAPSGFQYSAKYQRIAAVTNVGPGQLRYVVETPDTLVLQGKQVTLSFYAKKGANYSASSSELSTVIYTGTGIDEGNASMGSWTGVSNTVQSNTLTTSWQRFTQTVTLGSGVREIGLIFQSAFVGTAGADDSVYITGVQLEEGSSASNFEFRPVQEELALCQRYYEKSYDISTDPGTSTYYGCKSLSVTAATVDAVPLDFKVTKRTTPTIVFYSPNTGTTAKCDADGSDENCSAAHIGESGATASNTGASAINMSVHYTADAEL